jgi:hypothetical protein
LRFARGWRPATVVRQAFVLIDRGWK